MRRWGSRRGPLAHIGRGQVDLQELAERSEARGMSGALLENVVREAAFEAMREDLTAATVRLRHFEAALARVSLRHG